MDLKLLCSSFPGDLSHDQILELFYKEVLRVRMVEEGIAEHYHEQEMRCPVHLSTGQEASAVGICQTLTKQDQIFSTHRSHAHYLAKGGDLRAMLSELYGKATGCTGGRGGSMHLMDIDAGVQSSIPIVASSIALATGFGYAEKRKKTSNISVAFFGDACVEEGVFHESANFAAVAKLPVLFVCENNLYSVYTPLSERQPDRPLIDVAKAHGMKAWHADGNDVAASYQAASDAVKFVRDGNGPGFVVLDTYRWREHCGPNFDNHLGYRSEEEFKKWEKLCPVKRLEEAFDVQGGPDASRRQEITDDLTSEIENAFEFAKVSPLPDIANVRHYVYSE
ncbi:thiamine pyrophosphate-dependent dehydrogenase E1 component subunit alpha [Rhodospirillales bacterium]|nr:thiamine pyrophosphate-dependent dehydrogenase E1 component subunit alpha [Rhodospirillales bacterium]